MITKMLTDTQEDLHQAAELLRAGQVVAFPTETVYGLGANALDDGAVARIFCAKGRPQDNPLIVHVACAGDAEALFAADERTRLLQQLFWPGPLTIIRPAYDVVPLRTRAGLATVAVRCPQSEVARRLITLCGVPLAAPSANRSGRPSPTTAAGVYHDMQGRVAAVVDGGSCSIGVESTVISLAGKYPRLLRPGGVTLEMLREVLGRVDVDDAVLQKLAPGQKAASPGMLYQHYAPTARVEVVQGEWMAQNAALCALYDDALRAGARPALLAEDARLAHLGAREIIPWGKNTAQQAARLYEALLQCDRLGYTHLFVPAVAQDEMGLAIMNRLLRAAAFRVVDATAYTGPIGKEEL